MQVSCHTEFDSVMSTIDAIRIPLPHIGSVNAWLLRGDPLTLVDTGPRNDEALAALEAGLAAHGLAVEDIELVLATHHHIDHVGLAATIKRRSGARIAVLEPVARHGAEHEERTARERGYSLALMGAHGVPSDVVEESDGFWDFLARNGESFEADVRLADGDRIRAGGRELRAVARPGHSTTDTLFVDDDARLAFAGDHLLARISSNTEMYPATPGAPRPRSRAQYLDSLVRTAAMPLVRLLTGHGRPVTAHRELVRARLAEHRGRCRRILEILAGGPGTAYGIAAQIWPERIVRTQPLLVVWEVLGHLDLLLAGGLVAERAGDDGRSWFSLAAPK